MKHLSLIFIQIFIISCCNSTQNEPTEIKESNPIGNRLIKLSELPQRGDYLPDSIRLTSQNRMQLVNSSSFSPATSVYYNSFIFEIAWNEANKVHYISTTDKNFATPENVKINTTLKEIMEIQKVHINKMPGWGYYLKLNSDWNVAFCVDESCTGRDISVSDSVKWIFK